MLPYSQMDMVFPYPDPLSVGFVGFFFLNKSTDRASAAPIKSSSSPRCVWKMMVIGVRGHFEIRQVLCTKTRISIMFLQHRNVLL